MCFFLQLARDAGAATVMSAHLQLTRLEQHLQGWVGLVGLDQDLLLAHQWIELTRIFAVLYNQI